MFLDVNAIPQESKKRLAVANVKALLRLLKNRETLQKLVSAFRK